MDKQLTRDQLMAPRYKVIADYPKSIYDVGTVVRAGGQSEDFIYCDFKGPRMRDYPHLFRKMGWWEDREESEMPEYISYRFMPESQPRILKVEKHFSSCYGEVNRNGFISDVYFFSYSKTTVATEEEYNTYINSLTLNK